MSDEGYRMESSYLLSGFALGSFATKETTPIMDVKTECLISERAVYGHWESEVVNMRYFLMAKNVTPFTTKPARIFNESSNIGSPFTISSASSIFARYRTCLHPQL
jgi:hypothetical protein